MTAIFKKEHPEYVRIESHIRRARAERALQVGEAIGNALVALTRAVRGSRPAVASGSRKPA